MMMIKSDLIIFFSLYLEDVFAGVFEVRGGSWLSQVCQDDFQDGSYFK